MLSTLLQAVHHTSAAGNAARAAAAAASRVRVARRPAAASRSARSAAAAASIAVRKALLYTDEDKEEKEEEEEERWPPSSLPAYDPVPGKDVTEKDVESDEAIWALYELWCKAYNKERDHGEMARRFNRFKESAESVYHYNKGCYTVEEQKYLGKFADGINAQEMVEVESLRGCSDPKGYLESAGMFIESPNQSP